MVADFFSSNLGLQIFFILVGLAVLTLGRKLFWLAVAALGFVLGLGLGIQLTHGQADWVVLVVALFVGGLGALLALLAQKIAVGVAGFLLGGYLATWLLQLLGFEPGQWVWILFIIGGIIGLILALSLLEMALIALTALIGASLIVRALQLSPALTGVLFLALLVVGVVVQAKMLAEKS
ncbi:MAG: DUF4203 domain-containing protein [Anaerolineae bacterium]|nr:DUF4203 domain-containing protein [Anaerolineae bacterium]